MKRVDESVFRLDGRVAVVTGGAGGICSAICRAYANVGAKVACLDYDGEAAQALAASIREAGGEAIGLACDVSDEQATLAAVQNIKQQLGAPTVLLNGAAVLDRTGSILEIDPQEWQRVMSVNLTGVYLMSRAVLPEMIAAGGGSIIHLASMHGRVGRAGRVSYTTAKAALIMLAQNMAMDHADDGVRVNSLSPGAVATRRITYRYGENAQEQLKAAAQKYLMKRFADPDEMVGAALFLASDASSYMTGADLLVDGGYCAA
ncbi:SDR family NAD(P)-dependent oxidoreductase [Ottowia thiooxydans]|uniref:NAD(P)-dependent dehydrogenase (Short-subunit alcohol dehydrogenase family) n=1 Tax=Ottowia thiooxydans TaxID=219182 RepID=A0ABV2QIL8_9BURK